MATLRDIRKKIKSTRAIQKTTRAMQMISSVRFQKSQSQMNSAKPYAEKIQQLLSDMLKKIYIVHPFLKNEPTNKKNSNTTKEGLVLSEAEGLLIITSERGLCGGYNTNILKKTLEYIQNRTATEMRILVIGKKGRDYLKRNGISISHEYFDVFKNFSSVSSEIISNEIIKLFLSKGISKFSVIYSEYRSLFFQPVIIKQLLPIEKFRPQEFEFDFIYEPSREIILDKLLNRYIKSEIFKILIEAYTSEIISRRNAMENATKNAEELIDGLTLSINKLRQQQITRELTEIVSASESS